jgi:hypothetical protein
MRKPLSGLTSLSRVCGMKLPFLILHILHIPVKPFGCGYAALSLSWLNVFSVFTSFVFLFPVEKYFT